MSLRTLLLALALAPLAAGPARAGEPPAAPAAEPAPAAAPVPAAAPTPAAPAVAPTPAAAPTPAPAAPAAVEAPPAAAAKPAPGRAPAVAAGPNVVRTVKDAAGWRLQIDGVDTMLLGMNWGYIPIGENYAYDLWKRPDAFIEAALEREMPLLKALGANAIRQYAGIPPRWVTYIWERWGIYTMVNHLAGRYGFIVDGVWRFPVDYSDARTRAVILADVAKTVAQYKDTPGVVMWLLGNESNYGLEWRSAEIEALPKGERMKAKAVHLYSLMGEVTKLIKGADQAHPVALANGDLQYIDLIAEHLPDLDVMGSNVYRGKSARDLFAVVKAKLDLPFVFTEFGADAYNAREGREDAEAQARYLTAQWQEIYEQSHGKGRVGNAIGGFVFQWSDGWWKFKQEENLDVHDTNASWPNGGYAEDFVAGANNMNEEWFGICAKGPTDEAGHFELYPRTAYWALRAAWRLAPYAAETTRDRIAGHFGAIDIDDLATKYRAARAQADVSLLSRFRVSQLRLELEFPVAGGSLLEAGDATTFDHLESVWLGIAANPFRSLRGEVVLNVLGNVPTNPIDELFWERVGQKRTVRTSDGKDLELADLERLRVHEATVSWEEPWFTLEGYYRKGHNHWGDQGDFFGLYREAYYGDAIDIYQGIAPFGMVFAGKQELDFLKIAFGPQLYWGANPAVLVKLHQAFGDVTVSAVHQEDIARQAAVATSAAVPERVNRKTTLAVGVSFGAFKLDLGGIFAGSQRVGEHFVAVEDAAGAPSYLDSGVFVRDDAIRWEDTLGAKVRLTWDGGAVKWFLQGAYQGLVADGGVDSQIVWTRWTLRPSQRGNQWNVGSGVLIGLGDFQIAPNVLYQKPLEGPVPQLADYFGQASGRYYPGTNARNVLDDPFAVLENRETLGFELLLAYDPTPGSWWGMWDNDQREDADFAGTLDFVYRHQPTSRDANFGFTDNVDMFAFPSAPPAHDVWDVGARLIFNPGSDLRILARLYAGQDQARGDDARLVTRAGLKARLVWRKLALDALVKINDWGPYDYHRDFNLTFPVQLMADLSWAVGLPRWLDQWYARIGLKAQLRYLDRYSPRIDPDRVDPDAWGSEWELRTYLHVGL